MKKVALLVLVFVLIAATALAENEIVVVDTDKLMVTLTSAQLYASYDQGEETNLVVGLIVENKTDYEVDIFSDSVGLNDWEVEASYGDEIKPHKKKRNTLLIHHEQGYQGPMKDVDSLVLYFTAMYDDDDFTFDQIESEPITGEWLGEQVMRKDVTTY